VVQETKYKEIIGWEDNRSDVRRAEVADVAVAADGLVYLLTRNDPQVVVHDSDGKFVRAWGRELLAPTTHGITLSSNGSVYCVLHSDQTVKKFTPEGELELVIGVSGELSDTGCDWSLDPATEFRALVASIKYGGPPFNCPTAIAIAGNGDLYVADGYGNSRVHRFTSDGALIASWGQPGTGPGEFHVPHGILITSAGQVLVADRENDRVQEFTLQGDFVSEWSGVHRPTALCEDSDGRIFVTESTQPKGWYSWTNGVVEEALPPRVSIFDDHGQLLEHIRLDEFGSLAPHGIAVDSEGRVFVAEVVTSFCNARAKCGDIYPPGEYKDLHVLARA
jgi:hypothetical protein